VDRLLVARRPLAAESLAGPHEGGEPGGQRADLAWQGRGAALGEAPGGPLGIGPGPLAAPTLGGAGRGPQERVALQRTGPPRRRSLRRRVSGGVARARPGVIPRGLRSGLIPRNRGLGPEAGGPLVGEVPELVVALHFEACEAGGVAGQWIEPWSLPGIDRLGPRGGEVVPRGDPGAGRRSRADLQSRLEGAG
jgi:hypothetical protein